MKTQPSRILPRAQESTGPLTRLRHVDVSRGRGKVAKKFSRPRSDVRFTITHSTRGLPSTHRMQTRGATAAAARNAVFNTAELLEAILLLLPPKDLCGTVGAVCRAWRDCVDGSVRARRARFVEGITKHTLLTYHRGTHTLALAQLGGPPATTKTNDAEAATTTITTSKLNTLLFTPLAPPNRPSLVDRSTVCETLSFAPFAQRLLSTLSTSTADSKTQTERTLLLANPSPQSIELEVAFTLTAINNNRRRVPRTTHLHASLAPERHSLTTTSTSPTRTAGLTFADLLREVDAILYYAQRRWMRAELARGKGPIDEGSVGLDVSGCKVWMRGVVFPTGEEMGWLREGEMLGREGVVVVVVVVVVK